MTHSDRARTGRRAPRRGDGLGFLGPLESAVITASTINDDLARRATVGEPVELVRYRTAAGDQRALYGQRVGDGVRITDVPADGRGSAYLVERGLEQDGSAALLALVRDYLDRAEMLGIPPMSATPLVQPATRPRGT